MSAKRKPSIFGEWPEEFREALLASLIIMALSAIAVSVSSNDRRSQTNSYGSAATTIAADVSTTPAHS